MRLGTIVIGMDFSDTAVKSAIWANAHFAPTAAATLVHVIAPPDRPGFAAAFLPAADDVERAARDYAVKRMQEVAALLTHGSVRSEIRVGKPHEQLTKLVGEIGADLVVVGPHSDRPRPSRFLGTTAERIVRTSSVPVLVATDPPAGRPRRMLVPVDDLAITPTLLDWARALAEAFDAEVALLHVWSNAVYSHVASMSAVTTANDADAQTSLEEQLRAAGTAWIEEIARTGMRRDRVTATVTYGRPGDVILESADTMRADLIVLGRRGSGLVAPALLGSTVGTVLHGANCPVLVITEPNEG